MSSGLPWSQMTQVPPTNDPTAVLQQIERTTASLLSWMKILVAAVIVLIIVTGLYI